jgi:hypothetical protein
MRSPAFAGSSVDTATSSGASQWRHVPSLPSRGQLAPPQASRTASALIASSPIGVRTCRAGPWSKPTTWARVLISTPSAASRASQARKSGEAFMALGKTRPLDPTNVVCPRPSAQSTSIAGG